MDEGLVGLLIPTVWIMIGAIVAVTAIMTGHQRRMAKLVHENLNHPGLVEELRQLRGVVNEMRTELNTVPTAMDDMKTISLPVKDSDGSIELRVREDAQ